MPEVIFVYPDSADDHGGRAWSKKDDDAAVAYAEMPVFTEGALLAVEMTPGCGYGVVGPCEAMIKEHRSCLGYGAFYIEEKAPG